MFLIFTAKRKLLDDGARSTWSGTLGVRLQVQENADILREVHPFLRAAPAWSFLPGAPHNHRRALADEIEDALHVEFGGRWMVLTDKPVSVHESYDSLAMECEESICEYSRSEHMSKAVAGSTYAAALVKMTVSLGPRDPQHLDEVVEVMGGHELSPLEMFEFGVDVEEKEVDFDVVSIADVPDVDQTLAIRGLMRQGYVPHSLRPFLMDDDISVAAETLQKLAHRLVLGRQVDVGKYRRAALIRSNIAQDVDGLLAAGGEARRMSPERFLRLVTGWGSKRGIYVAPPMKKSRWARIITEGMP